jgi:hypothetical protein
MVRRLALFASALLLLGVQACTNDTASSAEEVIDHRVEIPTPPAVDVGLQFVQPEQVIPPGSEVMTCWVPDWVPDRDYFVKRFTGLQGTGGHHVVALTSAVPREAGEVFDCTDIESLAGFRPLILPDLADRDLLPDDMYVRLPADAKIVIQSHYVNYSDRAIRVADVARFDFATDVESGTEAGYFIMNHAGVDLAPRSPGEVRMSCTSVWEQPLNFLLLFGHMHEMGTEIRIGLGRAEDDETLYEIDRWQPEFRDLAPITFFDRADPLTVGRGDTVNVRCNYDNPTDEPIRFPSEMCTAVAYYYPALPGEDRVIICDD